MPKPFGPDQAAELGEPGLLSMVQSAIRRAGALGLLSEFDVVRFVNLYFILAADFETNPLSMWVRPIFADKTLAPVAKLDRIYQRMEDEFTLIEKRRGPRTS